MINLKKRFDAQYERAVNDRQEFEVKGSPHKSVKSVIFKLRIHLPPNLLVVEDTQLIRLDNIGEGSRSSS